MGGGNIAINTVWNRIFGTFQGEAERPRYGLTTNIRTFRPTRVAFPRVLRLGARRARRQQLARAARLCVPRPWLVARRQRRVYAGVKPACGGRLQRKRPSSSGVYRIQDRGTKRPMAPSSIVVIIVGIVLALLVNYLLGIIVILIGLAMLLMPMLGARRRV
jgi:hypothetical protein